MSGEYRITMALGGLPVPGSPFKVPCQQPRPCEVLSRVHYGTGQAFAGERYSTRVTVLDQFGQRVSGEPRLTANVMDGEELLFTADVMPTDSVGDWMVVFTPTISGMYSLVLEFDGGRSLAGSPHRVRVKTDETVAGNCKLYGPGLTRAVAGERTSFSIKAVDGKNNARMVGGDDFQVEILGPGNTTPKPNIVDNNDGTYTVHWVTEKAGDYLITGWLEGCTVGGCAKACAVQPGPLDASHCSCAGEGLDRAVAGVPATFIVTACDRFGNKQTAGGDDVSVRVTCVDGERSGTVAGKVEDAGRALYKAAYTVSTAGAHEVVVLAGGKPVPGSPFRAEVSPGQVSAGACQLSGPGLSAIQLGRDMRVFVALADAFGNAITEASAVETANVKVKLEGPAETHVRRGPVGEDGRHAFSYSTKKPGDYVISATVAGSHMQGSPAAVTASISEAHALLCEVVGTPLHLATIAGQSADVTFVAKDAKGVQKSLGGDTFTVSWKRVGLDDEPATTGKVEDLGTGEYRARFMATAAGAHSVWVQHKGQNIAGSPFSAEVAHSTIAADCSYVVQEGLERGVTGSQVSFRVRAMDRYLNLVRLPQNDSEAVGPKGFQAMLLGPGKNEQSLELVPNWASSGGCELWGSFVPWGAGLAALAVTYQGHHIKGSPWQVTISCGPACARKSALIGMPQHLVAGVTNVLTVHARDASGCPTEGRDPVSITVDSVSEGVRSLPIKDRRDGTYTAPISLEKVGLVSISAMISGQPLGLPVTLRVLPAQLHSLELISPQNPQTVAGEPAFVALSTRDAFLNPILSGGAKLVAQLRTFHGAEAAELAAAPAEVRDRSNGVYEIDCALRTACDFEISVHVDGMPETKVTCAGMCRPAATCPARCELPSLPALLPAAQPGSFATWRFDRFGNRLTSSVGEAPFLATGTGPGELKTKVLENGDGSAQIRYCASKVGTYTLAVTSSRDGEHLAGSPFQFDVTPGQLSPCHCTATLASATLVAGEEAAVGIDAKDMHGNQVTCMEGHDVAVHMQGPCTVALVQEAGSQGRYSAQLPTSGTYLAHVQINGHTLAGWPRTIHATAGASEASRCAFLGRSLASGAHTIGEPWRFTLHTADGHGNARAAGGEAVTVDVAGPAGSAVRAAVVADCGNGCYSVAFEPDCAGRWLLTPRHATA
ncbi:g10169 [Coccomyxa elongata]